MVNDFLIIAELKSIREKKDKLINAVDWMLLATPLILERPSKKQH